MKNNVRVSMFKNARCKRTCGTVLLWDWLLERNSSYTPLIAELRNENNLIRQKQIKELLPGITVSCVCSERSAGCIEGYTNLICIDIDGKDNPSISDMEALKKKLSKLPYIMYCGLSASGKGLFCIIPYFEFNKHKLYFNALEQEFKEMGVVVDSNCSDIGRLRFYSHDTNPYVNPDAEVYVLTLEKSSEMKQSKPHQRIAVECSSIQTLQTIDENVMSLEEFFLLPTDLDNGSAIPLSKTQKVERLLNKVIDKQIDITLIYNDWIAVCYIIRNLFDEEGRALFHQISSFYPNYNFDETDSKYSSTLKGEYFYNTDRLFEIAVKYGLK